MIRGSYANVGGPTGGLPHSYKGSFPQTTYTDSVICVTAFCFLNIYYSRMTAPLRMGPVRHYRDLVVWQQSLKMVSEVYRATASFPSEERFGLTAQIRRAAVSVPSNIAEGQGRCSTGEFRQFLGHARGSLLELETQLLIARHLGYLTMNDSVKTREFIERVGQMHC